MSLAPESLALRREIRKLISSAKSSNISGADFVKSVQTSPNATNLINFLHSEDCKCIHPEDISKEQQEEFGDADSPFAVATQRSDDGNARHDIAILLVTKFGYLPVEELVIALIDDLSNGTEEAEGDDEEEAEEEENEKEDDENNNNDDDVENESPSLSELCGPRGLKSIFQTNEECNNKSKSGKKTTVIISDEERADLQTRIRARINECRNGGSFLTQTPLTALAQIFFSDTEAQKQWFSFLVDELNANPNAAIRVPKSDYDAETTIPGEYETETVTALSTCIKEENFSAFSFLVHHPRLRRPALTELAPFVRFLSTPCFFRVLEEFPALSCLSNTSELANVIFDDDDVKNAPDYSAFAPPERQMNVALLQIDNNDTLDKKRSAVLPAEFCGTSNPQRLGQGPNWVNCAVQCCKSAYQLKNKLLGDIDDAEDDVADGDGDDDDADDVAEGDDDDADDVAEGDDDDADDVADGDGEEERVRGATWCYNRFGVAVVPLPESKYLCIGGEHEDSYDPDFCIYNDVFVFDAKNHTYEMFAYPREVFMPTDFASATLIQEEMCVYIIGNCGYNYDREETSPDICQVMRLDLVTMKMEKIVTNNSDTAVSPGWMHRHVAWLDDDTNPTCILLGGGESYSTAFDPKKTYKFDLATRKFY